MRDIKEVPAIGRKLVDFMESKPLLVLVFGLVGGLFTHAWFETDQRGLHPYWLLLR